jgi:alpha/beta superfamily hydrolase
MTIKERSLCFPSSGKDAIQLEGILHRPSGRNLAAVVVCHPHSLYGGSMDVPLVVSIARTLAQRGIMALRFNFRGVSRSEGEFGGGLGELNDVAGAVDTLLREGDVNLAQLCLVGYSFGAWVGLHHAERDPHIQCVAAIGLPLGGSEEGFLSGYTRPKLFIAGEHDSICLPDRLRRFVERLRPPKDIRILRRTDHFLVGREREVAEMVADFMEMHTHDEAHAASPRI